jgi:hypothetical protein
MTMSDCPLWDLAKQPELFCLAFENAQLGHNPFHPKNYSAWRESIFQRTLEGVWSNFLTLREGYTGVLVGLQPDLTCEVLKRKWMVEIKRFRTRRACAKLHDNRLREDQWQGEFKSFPRDFLGDLMKSQLQPDYQGLCLAFFIYAEDELAIPQSCQNFVDHLQIPGMKAELAKVSECTSWSYSQINLACLAMAVWKV